MILFFQSLTKTDARRRNSIRIYGGKRAPSTASVRPFPRASVAAEAAWHVPLAADTTYTRSRTSRGKTGCHRFANKTMSRWIRYLREKSLACDPFGRVIR